MLNKEELDKLRKLSEFLDGELSFKEENHLGKALFHQVQILPKGELFGFFVYRNNRHKLFRFRAFPPNYSKGFGSPPAIGMNLNRSVESLAADLKRRLFPEAKDWIKLLLQNRAATEFEAVTRRQIFSEVALANGVSEQRLAELLEKQDREVIPMRHFSFATNYRQTNHRGKFRASVEISSLSALKMIAAICSEDYNLSP